jgi:hypothetical protein
VGIVVLDLTASNGCDSIVTITTTLISSYNITVNETTCDPSEVGTVVLELIASNGCDSIVTITTTLISSYNISVNETTCDPSEAGTIVLELESQFGCDSIVTIITTLLESYETNVFLESCDPSEVGVIVLDLTASNGCDSIITITTTLLESYEIVINLTTCDPNEIGTEMLELTASNGCDSIVMIVTTLLLYYEIVIEETTCDSLAEGIEVLELQSVNGCDSIVTIVTTYVESFDLVFYETTCNAELADTVVTNIVNDAGCPGTITLITTYISPYETIVNLNTCSPANVGTEVIELLSQDGCDSIVTIITTLVSADFNLAFNQLMHPVCEGSASGALGVIATGGLPPYNYNWSNGNTGAQNLNLSEGIYSVTVTDANSCTRTLTIQLIAPDPPISWITIGSTECMSAFSSFYQVTYEVLPGVEVFSTAGTVMGGMIVNIPSGQDVTISAVHSDGCEQEILIQGIICQPGDTFLNISGNIYTESGIPFKDAQVIMEGAVEGLEISDSTGFYLHHDIPAGSAIEIAPLNDLNTLNGITTLDAIFIQRHILSIDFLSSPYNKIAADLNNNLLIEVGDLIQLRRLIILIDDDFVNPANGVKINNSWKFALPGLIDPLPTSPFVPPFSQVRTYVNLESNFENQDFIAIKMGDVNNTADPTLMQYFQGDEHLEIHYRSSLVFMVDDVQTQRGEYYTVDFKARDFKNIDGFQYTMKFDATSLEFIGLTQGALRDMSAKNIGLTYTDEGYITFSWNAIDADLPNDEVLFSLEFKALSNGRLSNLLEINSDMIRVEAYTGESDFKNVMLEFNSNQMQQADFALYQNVPNPFDQYTNISFDLPEAGEATLSIFDLKGSLLYQVSDQFEQGSNTITLQRSEINTSGVLFYQLTSGNYSATKRLITQ